MNFKELLDCFKYQKYSGIIQSGHGMNGYTALYKIGSYVTINYGGDVNVFKSGKHSAQLIISCPIHSKKIVNFEKLYEILLKHEDTFIQKVKIRDGMCLK